MSEKNGTMILLAAGSGKRMQTNTPKQYIELCGKPIICYCLDTIEKSDYIKDCIMVTSENDKEYVRVNILEKYGYSKVRVVCAGGAERFLSVMQGLKALKQYREDLGEQPEQEIIFVQDGARPFMTEEIIKNTYEEACLSGACVAAVPSKDTVKISDDKECAIETPNRNRVWLVQTPQVFQKSIVMQAYEMLEKRMAEKSDEELVITDDACVVEMMLHKKVKLVNASYRNIKITTKEDLVIAESFIKNKEE